MKVVLQRVLSASVHIDGYLKASINKGLLLYVGFATNDNEALVTKMCNKLVQLRVFDDAHQVPNLSVKDIAGEILSISQFTLLADSKKGNRPGFSKAARPEVAQPLYQFFNEALALRLEKEIRTGLFGADMQVTSVNDGPYTLVLDSEQPI